LNSPAPPERYKGVAVTGDADKETTIKNWRRLRLSLPSVKQDEPEIVQLKTGLALFIQQLREELRR
jgi:hypothetical protein